MGVSKRLPESAPTLPQQRVLTPVFLILPALAAVAVHLRAGHTLALSISAYVTARLMAVAVLGVWRQYLFGPSGQVLMILLHFLEKLYQFLISSPLGIVEVLHTSLTTLQGVIEHTNNVVYLVLDTSFMLSRSDCTLMACCIPPSSMYLRHTYSVIAVVTTVCDLSH